MPADSLKSLLTRTDLPIARIVRALSALGSATSLDLVRVAGLARSTVSTALAELRDAGLIVEVEARQNGMGRPTVLFSLTPDSGRCAGVLLGLDEIRIAICDMAHNVLSDRSVPMTRDYGPATAFSVVRDELGADCTALDLTLSDLFGVGLAVSAPISEKGVVAVSSVLPTWSGVDLSAVFGSLGCPVHADNESHCGALAEMTWGAAIGEPNFILIKFDLGIGGAIVLDGQVRRGLNGSAAEFGHLTLDPRGALCRCGNRGCLETMVGATHLLKVAGEMSGREVGLDEFVCAAVDGHIGYRRLIEDAADIAGWGAGLVGTVLDPPVVIVAGGLAKAGELFLDRFVKSYDRHASAKSATLPPERRQRFLLGRFLANDTVLGAVALVLHQQCRIA